MARVSEQTDGPRLVDIPREECLQLLASVPIGRVAVGRGAEPPLVVPVRVEPWSGGEKEHWIRLEPTSITGRRIELPEPVLRSRGYL